MTLKHIERECARHAIAQAVSDAYTAAVVGAGWVAAGESRVELLEALDPDSPIAKFIEKRGEGLHHVGYRVEDCATALQAVKDTGGRVIDEAPRPGSRGTTVAFVHPKTSFGTLIELVQE